MPRPVINESDDELEPKTGRRTRAALAASVTDSPIRRSTRIRHGSVNPDGSSPESITGAAATQVTRVTRRRANAGTSADASAVVEPTRTLRSRKNSVSSNVSENLDIEAVPGTPKTRAIKRLSIIESSPDVVKSGAKTRRSTRASSETKSPPPPVARTTRRTRATSIDPEPSIERAIKGAVAALAQSAALIGTPTKKRRQQVSALPSEPVLTEEDNEDKAIGIPEEVVKDENSPDKTASKSSRRSSSSGAKESEKNSLKGDSDAEVDADEGSVGMLQEKDLTTEILSVKDKSANEEAEEAKVPKSPVEIQTGNVSGKNIEAEYSPKPVQSLVIKAKRQSSDKSKELGMKIEDLLNKSTEEQEKSPGNKENEKLNVSPERIKKNLEFTVCTVNIVRGKSLGSTRFVNKSGERKVNTSLDERVLSKSRNDIVVRKSIEAEDNELGNNAAQNSWDLTFEKKLQPEIPSVFQSPKEDEQKEIKDTKSKSERSSSKISYTKVDETIVENEVIEEFTLYDSNDSMDDSKSEFSLTVQEDGYNEEKNSFSKMVVEDDTVDGTSYQQPSLTKLRKNESNEHSAGESECESSSDIFEKRNPSKNNSRKDTSSNIEGKKDYTPTKRLSFNSKESETSSEISKSENEEDKQRQSTKEEEKRNDIQNEESEVKKKDSEAGETENLDGTNSEKVIHQEEPMDTNEHEETETNKNSVPGSPESMSVAERVAFLEETSQSSNANKLKSGFASKVSDSDSSIAFDNLFQDISAEEWVKKKNNYGSKERQTKRRSSLKDRGVLDSDPSQESKININSEEDLDLVGDKSGEEKDEASDSDDTLILKNDFPKKTNQKKRTDEEMIVEEAESGDKEMSATVGTKKSPNKSRKSNTSMENTTNDKTEKENDNNVKLIATFKEVGAEIDDNLSDAETIPTNTDNLATLKNTNSSDEDIVEEKESVSSKNTPKNKKKKSPVKSATKSNKSADVYEFEDSSGSEEDDVASENSTDENETRVFANLKGKSKKKRERGSAFDKLRAPLDRNYSTVAVVDSDSGSVDITDPDCPSSDNGELTMPGYLFSVDSSGDENEDGYVEKEDSNNTMDSDIAKEMNLAGDNDLEFSDDNVPADDCRASETEHSDEEDDGSDIEDFIVNDDDVESSEYSEEELELGTKFKRILAKSSSEEEEEEEEENDEEEVDKSDKETEVINTHVKVKRNSLRETPNDDDSSTDKELAVESLELQKKKLNFSFESDKALSNKKTKKGKLVHLGESEVSISPSLEELEKVDKKLKKFPKPVGSLWDTTIDLCTPELNAKTQTKDKQSGKSPGLNTSANKKSVAKKSRTNLVKDLEALTQDETDVTEENQETQELTVTPKTKTPNKEKKTPKSVRKNQRDSMQLIEETASLKSNVSDLNKSMLTPNSESPVTKFLKKERLNESLPLLELKKRASKSFDNKALNKMNEDEQEGEDAFETNEPKDIGEESVNDESDANDDGEENGDEVNGNDHRDDEEEDGTDEESNKEEANADLEEENENESEEEESEESSEEETSVQEKKESGSKVIEQPEKSRKSAGRKSLSELEDNVFSQVETDVTLSRKQLAKRQSTASINDAVVNGESTESDEDTVTPNKKRQLSKTATGLTNKKKRAKLESSDTPKSLKEKKKIKIAANADLTLHDESDSDSDEAPESLGFSEARTEALQEMKDVAASLKAAKEAKKKKRRDQLEKIRLEKEAKTGKKAILPSRANPESGKNNLKRLPEDLLDNLSDVPQRPQKKRKLSKKEEQIVPSKYMFSPGKSTKSSLKIENHISPVSTGGGTTHFSVINLEKVNKQPKKAAAVASFRETMLARNPRQPISAFLMYQAKRKASGKQLSSRKQA